MQIPNFSDQNLNSAIQYGIKLSYPEPKFPNSLGTMSTRVALIKKFNEDLDCSNLAKHIIEPEYQKKIVVFIKTNIPTITGSDNEIVSLILRLWTGCQGAAKILSDKDIRGPIDSTFRHKASKILDDYAKHDAIFLEGIKSAKHYRELMGEPICFDGIPEESLIR